MQESRTITRRSASNLALAFVLLPKHKRDGMSALYAFCREVDDIADNEMLPLEQRREALNRWRADVARACAGESPEMAVNRELQPFIHQHHLPFGLFYDLASDVAQHARGFYQRAREILPEQDRRSMAAAELMGSVYWRLLRKLELQEFDVFGPHLTCLSKSQKLILIFRS